MNFLLEEYLKTSRTFRGPLADYVVKLVENAVENHECSKEINTVDLSESVKPV
jgi:hypothetical protein